MSDLDRDLPWSFETLTAKTHTDRARRRRPLSVPIDLASTFQAASSEDLGDLYRERGDQLYARVGHPTLTAAEAKLARLEGAEGALLFSSGMAAITTSLLAVLRPGDHVVSQGQVFGQTHRFLERFLATYGVSTTFVDTTDLGAVAAAVRDDTVLLFAESPSNPLLRIADLAALAALARDRGLLFFADATFASPFLQRTLSLGASLVLHSGSKILSGHSDVLCGVAAGSGGLVERIRELRIMLGGVPGALSAWLLLRGLKTLAVRAERCSATALRLARSLEGQPGVARVHYPGLDSSPFHRIASQQMRAGGGVVSFEVKGGLAAVRRFLDALQLIPVATSLGGTETLAEAPWELETDDTGETGSEVPQGLIRLSVGLEDPGDLMTDLDRGLATLA